MGRAGRLRQACGRRTFQGPRKVGMAVTSDGKVLLRPTGGYRLHARQHLAAVGTDTGDSINRRMLRLKYVYAAEKTCPIR